jgi:hypothetical protein
VCPFGRNNVAGHLSVRERLQSLPLPDRAGRGGAVGDRVCVSERPNQQHGPHSERSVRGPLLSPHEATLIPGPPTCWHGHGTIIFSAPTKKGRAVALLAAGVVGPIPRVVVVALAFGPTPPDLLQVGLPSWTSDFPGQQPEQPNLYIRKAGSSYALLFLFVRLSASIQRVDPPVTFRQNAFSSQAYAAFHGRRPLSWSYPPPFRMVPV